MNTKSEEVAGTVKFFNRKKGFGFIVVEGRSDAFFHASWLEPQGFCFDDLCADAPVVIDYGIGERDLPAVLKFHQVGDKKAKTDHVQATAPAAKRPSRRAGGRVKKAA